MTDLQRVTVVLAILVGAFLYIQLLCLLISWWSGWRALVRRFRHDQEFYGTIFRMQSARFRAFAHYNNAIDFSADSSGIYMRTIWIVPQHPPLHIPWSEIKIVKREKFWIWEYTHYRLGTQEHIPMAIRSELSDKLHQEAGRTALSSIRSV